MTGSLQERLEDAAGTDAVSFDHHDVRARAQRRRRRRRVVLVAVVVVAVVGIGSALRARDDDQQVDSAGTTGGVTRDELVADRWVPSAYSAVLVAPDGVFVEFSADGGLSGMDACGPFQATFELRGVTLHVDELTSPVPPGGSGPTDCVSRTGLLPLLSSDPAVGRFEGEPRSLLLRSGSEFIGFQRFDRLGDPPERAALIGTWAQGDGLLALTDDGRIWIRYGTCAAAGNWTLDGDVLHVTGIDESGVDCADGSVAGGGLFLLATHDLRLRVTPSFLWVSSPLGVTRLDADQGARSSADDLAPYLLTDPEVAGVVPDLGRAGGSTGDGYDRLSRFDFAGPTQGATRGVTRLWGNNDSHSPGDPVEDRIIGVSSTVVEFPTAAAARNGAELTGMVAITGGATALTSAAPFRALCEPAGSDLASCVAAATRDDLLVVVQVHYVGTTQPSGTFRELLADLASRLS